MTGVTDLRLTLDDLGPLPPFLDRPSAPVSRIRSPAGHDVWLVADYALARQALTDGRLSRAAAARPGAPGLNTVGPSPTSIMSLDGADHARLRRMTVGAFSPRRIAGLRPFMEQVCDELLDRLDGVDATVDLVAALASPLPLTVLCALLGVPREDLPLFESAVEVLFDLTASTQKDKLRRQLQLVDYMTRLIGRRRDAGTEDDLLDELARANDGGRLSEGELVNLALAVLMAGYETTAGQIAVSALALLTGSPGRVAPEVPDTVVDELIRLTPATPVTFPRVAVADVPLGDVVVRTGEAVVISLLHANRDPAAFDDPDRVASGRRPALSFGHGAHRCLGATLATVQTQVALERLFHRYPAVRPDPAAAVDWKQGLITRGLAALPVLLSPSS